MIQESQVSELILKKEGGLVQKGGYVITKRERSRANRSLSLMLN